MLEQLGPVNYRIERSPRSKKFVAHVDKLKRCFTDDELSPVSEARPANGQPDDTATTVVDSLTPIDHQVGERSHNGMLSWTS